MRIAFLKCRLSNLVLLAAGLGPLWPISSQGEVSLPSIYSDHMVLQRDTPFTIWGWASPGERVTVSVAQQTQTAQADGAGRWSVPLSPLSAAETAEFRVSGESGEVSLDNVAVGDVWLCSGQSNMAWAVEDAWNADLEIPKANRPLLRLVTVQNSGAQHAVHSFRGQWTPCTPESVRDFSAVGYYFGRELQERLNVPIGLIDNAWGGSTCEAWVPTSLLERDLLYESLLNHWRQRVEAKASDFAQYEQRLTAIHVAGKSPPPKQPWDDPISERVRPGNLFFSRLSPVLPAQLRGVIWYQGEANTNRPKQYRELFPLMIQAWRDAFNQADLPFYWSQLPDFNREGGPPRDSMWAQLREAQTLTLDRLAGTGQAITIDLGEAGTIHPREKEAVGRRLARLALGKTYGLPVAWQSPRFEGLSVEGSDVTVRFAGAEDGLCVVDAKQVLGFTLAGEDKKFHPADAKLLDGGRVRVSSSAVTAPVAVRYAWANNPSCNLYSTTGLPVTPFRSDDWPVIADKSL